MEKTELMQVVKLLDKIISSKNIEIKDAFRELLIVATLTETPSDDAPGPLATLIFTEMEQLRHEVALARKDISSIYGTAQRAGKSYYEDYYRGIRDTGQGYVDPFGGATATQVSKVNWQQILAGAANTVSKSKKV